MRPYSDQDVIAVWEEGLRQHPLERAVTLLHRAAPHVVPQRWAAVPLGEVNARLLRLHHLLFGQPLHCAVTCPQCGGRLEFEFDTTPVEAGLETDDPADADKVAAPVALTLEEGAARIEARLPTLGDLAAAARAADVSGARHTLASRCIVQAWLDGKPAEAANLPDAILERLAQRLADADPAAEILLRLECPHCRHAWTPALDPVEFLWTRLAAHARSLLMDVHVLARAYGWSEKDILGLSASRRQAYLEMVGIG